MDNRTDPIEIIARVGEDDGKRRALEVWCFKAGKAGWSVTVESSLTGEPGAECAVVDVEGLRYRIRHAKRVRRPVAIVPAGQHLIAATVALYGGEADGVTWTWGFEHAVWAEPIIDDVVVETSDEGACVGTWDVGPFDNDTAADWCAELDAAAAGERVPLIRGALSAVVEHGEDYLDSDFAVEAIAAAAIVASQLPGGAPIDSSYAPGFLLDGGTIKVPADVARLALLALDRIVGDNSEWRQLRQEDPDAYVEALAALEPIRATLQRAAS